MPHNDEKILIVDDERRICDSLKDLLSAQGYEIKICCNGHDAMEHLTKDTFDLVLLDIGMEEMDGFQVMERMACQHLDIPVIIMTGNASTASAVKALRKGAYDYLRKPFEPDELYTSVKNALNQGILKIDNDRVNRKLRESEERFKTLFNQASDCIFIVDPVHKDGPVIVDVNEVACITHGYTSDEFIGKPFSSIYAEETRKYGSERVQRLMRGERLVFESEHIRKDGTLFPVEVSARMINIDGNPYLFFIGRNITRRKREEEEKAKLEAQNRQLQKAESLGRMAGAIAHHFNNQLMVVTGNLELVMEDLPAGNTFVKYLAEAKKAARRAAEVSGLMLTYLGQTTVQQEPMDICEVCNLSLSLLQATLPKRILLETKLALPGPVINGDVRNKANFKSSN